MRATFIGGEGRIRPNVVANGLRSIDLAPTIAYLLDIPEPQHSQGVVRLDLLRGGESRTLVPFIGLNDFHGQLEPTSMTMDGRNVSVGGGAYLATLFDQDAAALPRGSLLFASGDNVGASPPNSALLEDMPAIDVENAWGLDATSYGNHEFDYGIARLQAHQERADFPFLGANIVSQATGQNPDWVEGTHVFTSNGHRIGVIGIELENTPELVKAGNTRWLRFLPELQTIRRESERLRRDGIRIQVVLIHDGSNVGSNRVNDDPAVPWVGLIVDIAKGLEDTTVDVISAGHTHRVSNLMVGDILVVEGINAGASYSVVQMVVQGGDVEWAGGATRIAKSLGVAQRADVKAIVDKANADTAVLRNQVSGTQQFDIKRAPTRLFESAMGNMVTDAMRGAYPGGTPRHQLRRPAPGPQLRTAERREQVRDHVGRDVRRAPVRQPHGDPHAHGRPAPGGVRERLHAVLLRRLPGRDGPLPAGAGAQGHLRPATARPRSSPGCGRRRTGSAGRRRRSARRTPSASSPTTSCSPVATATRCSPAARTSSSRATTCSRSRSTTSRPTHRSARWSKAASSARSARSREGAGRTLCGRPSLPRWLRRAVVVHPR